MSLAQAFGGTGFARFINSRAGRASRVVAGLALIAWGYSQRGGVAGIVLIVMGLVPLAAGGLDWCLISALLGGPIRGSVLRAAALAKRP